MARLIDSYSGTTTEIRGRWFVARPIPSDSIWDRIHDAWLVLIGKADAVTFAEDGCARCHPKTVCPFTPDRQPWNGCKRVALRPGKE
jgi:hypothetical protein